MYKSCIALCMALVAEIAPARYVVTDFGANGSDSKDDAVAIQSALNVARGAKKSIEVYVPAGTYQLGSALAIFSNTRLVLDAKATFLRMSCASSVMLLGAHMTGGSACSRDAMCAHGGYSQITNVCIRGGVWDGGSGLDSIKGAMLLPHGDNIQVASVTFRRFTEHVLNCSASRNVQLTNLKFEDMLRFSGTSSDFWSGYKVGDKNRFLSIEAIHLDVANQEGEPSTYPLDNTPCCDVRVSNCSFSNCFAGIGNHHVIKGVVERGISIQNCSFTNLCSYAIHAHGFDNGYVSGNVSDNSLGMIWSKEANLVLTNNAARCASGDGMLLMTGTKATVIDNKILSSTKHGLHIEGSTVKVYRNEIADSGQCGIRILESPSCQIRGNSISSSGESGLSMTSCMKAVAEKNMILSSTIAGVTLMGGSATLNENSVTDSKKLGFFFSDGANVVAQKNSILRAVDAGVYLKNTGDGVSLSNNAISNIENNAINAVECDAIRIVSNKIAEIGKHAISFTNVKDGILLENYINEVQGRGVTVSGGKLNATGNHIGSVGNIGVYADSAASVALNGNNIINVNGVGVRLMSLYSPSIQRNVISNTCTSAVMLSNVSGAVVEGNSLLHENGSAILIANSSDCKVLSNVIDDVGECGIFYQNSTLGAICSNKVSQAYGFGIRIAGSSDADTIGNYVSSSCSSVRDICIESAVSGNKVWANRCGGNGISFTSAILSLVSYKPACVDAVLLRESDASATLSWSDVPVGGYGVGRYIVEYGHDPTFETLERSESIPCGDATTCVIPATEAKSPLYARVRFVHRISGVDYASTDDKIVSLHDCRIIYRSGGGIGVMPDTFCNPMSVIQLPKCLYSNPNKHLVGWLTEQGRLFDDGILVFSLVSSCGGEVVLTAKWQ